MNWTRQTVAVCALLICTACVAPKFVPQTPVEIKSRPIAISVSQSIDLDNAKALNASKTLRYSQNFGGGGVGLGLLLGPIGAGANAAMINGNTEKDVVALKDKFNLDPISLFRESAKDSDLRFADSGAEDPCMSPYVYIVKVEESGKLAIAASLLIESGRGEGRWVARYLYELPIAASLDPKTQSLTLGPGNLEELVRNGYKSILHQIQAETSESIMAEKDVVYTSDFITPRFRLRMKGKLVDDRGDRIWIRTTQGIYSLIKENVKVQL